MKPQSERVRVGAKVTIYPRGKKKIYVADFWFDGGHCRKSLETANKKIALERASQLDAKLCSGSYQLPPVATSLEEAAVMYIAYLTTQDRARKTIVKYRGIFKILLAFLKEHRLGQLAQFTARSFDQFREFRAQTRHRKTLYVEGVVIKQLLKWCKSRHLLLENPIADYKLEKPPLQPKSGPSLQQVNRILQTVPDDKRAMIALLAFTGMRAGELQRLRPGDLDLAGNWIRIVSRKGLETKTRESRHVPLHGRLRELLAEIPTSKKPWLFTMPPSRPYPDGDHRLNIKRLNEDFQKVVESLEMPTGREEGFTLHSLRHFFETFTVNAGLPQRVVDTWLGHRSDKSMAAVYYKLLDEDSQSFMIKVPFGTGVAAAKAVKEVGDAKDIRDDGRGRHNAGRADGTTQGREMGPGQNRDKRLQNDA